MNLITQFNNLNGKKKVSRTTLEKILARAKKEKHFVISNRISKILKENSDKTFSVSIENLVETSPVKKKTAKKKPLLAIRPVQKKTTVRDLKKTTVRDPKQIIAEVQKKETRVQPKNINKNSLAYRKAKSTATNQVREFYKIQNKEISDFIGNIEKKTKESVAITLAGEQGSGKSSFVFQLINAFAQNYKVGHASIEEHPESFLYEDKANRYWNSKSFNEVDAPVIESIQDIYNLVERNDVIIIDSFSKLKDLDKSIKLDKDLRKKFDGKLFIIIYQLTTGKQMRGGSDSQFDGDVVLFIEKNNDFNKNYVYNNKNRYQSTNLQDLKYNISRCELERLASKTKTKLSFNVKIN